MRKVIIQRKRKVIRVPCFGKVLNAACRPQEELGKKTVILTKFSFFAQFLYLWVNQTKHVV